MLLKNRKKNQSNELSANFPSTLSAATRRIPQANSKFSMLQSHEIQLRGTPRAGRSEQLPRPSSSSASPLCSQALPRAPSQGLGVALGQIPGWRGGNDWGSSWKLHWKELNHTQGWEMWGNPCWVCGFSKEALWVYFWGYKGIL